MLHSAGAHHIPGVVVAEQGRGCEDVEQGEEEHDKAEEKATVPGNSTLGGIVLIRARGTHKGSRRDTWR